MLQPKFSIGDKVWAARCGSDEKWVPCPDCIGQGIWTANLPNGETLRITCPTCQRGYDTGSGLVREYEIAERCFPGTVGSVQTDTHEESGRRVRYMFHETGVGGGSVYCEPDLFADEAEARSRAAEMAVEQVEAAKAAFAEDVKRKRKDRPGGFEAYCRSEIRRHEKEIERLREQIARRAKVGA